MIKFSATTRTLALLVLHVTLQAQTYQTSPAFDPAPLSIKSAAPAAPRSITIRDLIEMRDFKGVQISPDGKTVAYVVSQPVLEINGYRSAIFVVGTQPGSVPINLGSAGPPQWDDIGQNRALPPQWSPDSRYITHLLSKNGTRQIWSWKRDGWKARQLTHNRLDVQDYEWSSDGSKIFFTTTEQPNTEEVRKIAERGILWDGSISASRNLPILDAVIEKSARPTHLWVYEIAADRERKATREEEALYKNRNPPNDDPSAFKTKLSTDRKHIAYLSRVDDPQKFPYYGFLLISKELGQSASVELIPPTTLYIQDFWWNEDGSQIYYSQQTDDSRMALYVISANGGSPQKITKSNDLLHSFSLAKNLTRAVCIRENATTPPELAVVDLQRGSVHPLVQINPEFQAINLSPATRIEWTNKFSDKAFGHLIKPLNYEPGKRYPLIITTYRSSGFLRGGTGDEYPIQVFAANGFVVLDFDAPALRPPQRKDGKGNLVGWYSPMDSLETVVRMLEESGIVDPNRKGLTGLSYGAEIAQFTISHSKEFQAASTSGWSARDPLFYYLTHNGWHTIFKDLLGGWPEGEAAVNWRELSPALNAQQVTAPLLVQAADNEYLSGLQFYTALKELNKPVEMYIFPDEKHVKNQPQHRYNIYQRNLDWFNFWLQDKEDSDPAKRDQYLRWRAMKDQIRQKVSTLPLN